MARSKKKFSEYSPARQFWVAGVFILSLGLVAGGERDIQRRPAEQVRGSKLLWRLVCLNALGALSYFRWGRRPSSAAANNQLD
jgi:hypothetical protein